MTDFGGTCEANQLPSQVISADLQRVDRLPTPRLRLRSGRQIDGAHDYRNTTIAR